jgi:hypothetical protein
MTAFLAALYARLKGWRTMMAHALIGVASIAVMFYDQLIVAGVKIEQLLPRQVDIRYVGAVLVALSLLFGWLRMVTNTAVGQNVPAVPPVPPAPIPPPAA